MLKRREFNRDRAPNVLCQLIWHQERLCWSKWKTDGKNLWQHLLFLKIFETFWKSKRKNSKKLRSMKMITFRAIFKILNCAKTAYCLKICACMLKQCSYCFVQICTFLFSLSKILPLLPLFKPLDIICVFCIRLFRCWWC